VEPSFGGVFPPGIKRFWLYNARFFEKVIGRLESSADNSAQSNLRILAWGYLLSARNDSSIHSAVICENQLNDKDRSTMGIGA
jgi:hypothetical protein